MQLYNFSQTRYSVLQVAYFVNSGTEATELALMMARLYTGSFDIVALRNCYHGATLLGHGTWTYNLPQVQLAVCMQQPCLSPDVNDQAACQAVQRILAASEFCC